MIDMKIVINIVKRIIFAFVILYGFNIIMNAVDMFIPINQYTVGSIAILGFPGLFLLVGIFVFI